MAKVRMYASWLMTLAVLLGLSVNASAKDLEVTVTSDPEGAIVYLNGMIVAQTTPALVRLDKKDLNKNLMFRFEKKGYENKTVIMSFDKKDFKKNPIVYAKMDRDQEALDRSREARAAKAIERQDPTIPAGQGTARVSRDNAGATSMEKAIIRWYFDSDPRGARVFYRVISNNPAEVKNTNETYLTNTPYEETKGFSIPGLTYENSRNVTVEIKISKKGYEDQVKRYNVRQALDQQEISGFFELVQKDE